MDVYGTYGDFDGLTWLIGDFRAGFMVIYRAKDVFTCNIGGI